MLKKYITILLILLCISSCDDDKKQDSQLHIAVSSNFLKTLEVITEKFKQETNIKIIISSASTGKLYAQITHGAPYDIFLSADTKHPKLLEKENLTISNIELVYAVGRLVLWSPKKEIGKNIEEFLHNETNKIAIASPDYAPYGIAAKELLTKINLWNDIYHKIVYGENINIAFSYVATNNVDAGIIAMSQLISYKENVHNFIEIPQKLYTPLEQVAILLKRAENNKIAYDFLNFLKRKDVQKIILDSGYNIIKNADTNLT